MSVPDKVPEEKGEKGNGDTHSHVSVQVLTKSDSLGLGPGPDSLGLGPGPNSLGLGPGFSHIGDLLENSSVEVVDSKQVEKAKKEEKAKSEEAEKVDEGGATLKGENCGENVSEKGMAQPIDEVKDVSEKGMAKLVDEAKDVSKRSMAKPVDEAKEVSMKGVAKPLDEAKDVGGRGTAKDELGRGISRLVLLLEDLSLLDSNVTSPWTIGGR
ncbi:hypothetical protein PoB_001017400 [Plakobranchus ocellatus]|uniref:Uncharacterized protein n=1 Tax=Plakobranchus ocellatus TaxID=259542 RepID=A0AAV3YKW6_9GAST|nr:hypothetical protein PoB_001017400 [Plakobranchus ocellatus]